MFRNAIRYFSKQFNELKNDWDRNVEKIFQKSVVLERKEVEKILCEALATLSDEFSGNYLSNRRVYQSL